MQKLIIFEGVASSGKSTIINKLKEKFEANQQTVAVFPEEETLMPLVENRDQSVALAHLQKYLVEKILPAKEDILLSDRLHLTHAFRTNSDLSFFHEIENKLLAKFEVLIVLLTIDSKNISERIAQTLSFRGNNWGKGKQGTPEEKVIYYVDQQEKMKELIKQSTLPKIEIDTTNKDWKNYVTEIFKYTTISTTVRILG